MDLSVEATIKTARSLKPGDKIKYYCNSAYVLPYWTNNTVYTIESITQHRADCFIIFIVRMPHAPMYIGPQYINRIVRISDYKIAFNRKNKSNRESKNNGKN